jgi:uncharacterized membrane protein YdjX (TVP38/TMEM64 family)
LFWDFVYVSIEATIGATLAFLIAQYFAINLIFKKITGIVF